jgi:predicted nucleic acid-binding protein
VKLLFDTSVWVDHLRRAALDPVIGAIRGRFVLCFDAVVAAELVAGCRSKQERRAVGRLYAPHQQSGRLLCPLSSDFERAALALSHLCTRGQPPSGSKSALLDALIATVAARQGALLVTKNLADFTRLAEEIPVLVESYHAFSRRLLEDRDQDR